MNTYIHDVLIVLGFWSLAISLWGWRQWHERRKYEREYRDGIFQMVKALDLPIEEWEPALRTPAMTEEEWFGYQRGYTQALIHACIWFRHPTLPPVHTNRLEQSPQEK